MQNSFLKKYKPNNFNDFHISEFTKKLINIYIENNYLKFLIHGDNFSGKTCLINVILETYYKKDKTLIKNNIMHINLLKEQGINYYRNELKNFCEINNIIKDTYKKTVIFDDIDSLNDQSQQIFNTLINNYENINFIFSCNDSNKIHNNILNYLELIQINTINNNFLEFILNKILINENINMKKECSDYLIKTSNYSIPTLINNIDKLSIIYKDTELDNINIINLESIISNIFISQFDKYIELCKNKNYKESITYILNLSNYGYSVIDILDEFFLYIKNFSTLKDNYKFLITKQICNYINIFNNIHEDNIELIFLTNNIINIFNE